MDKKDFSVSLLVAGLSVLFVLASFALFLSKGKSKFWTAKKMKLGAIILSFTAVASTQQACVSCYDPIPPEFIYIENWNDTLNLNDSSILYGTIESRYSSQYSFKLQNDTIDSLIQVNNIFPDDGVYDEDSEEFTIQIDTSLQTGTYRLEFFDVNKEEQNSIGYPISQYALTILNEK